MSEQVNKEQTKGAKQEKITELSDEQLAEAQGGAASPRQGDEEKELGATQRDPKVVSPPTDPGGYEALLVVTFEEPD